MKNNPNFIRTSTPGLSKNVDSGVVVNEDITKYHEAVRMRRQKAKDEDMKRTIDGLRRDVDWLMEEMKSLKEKN